MGYARHPERKHACARVFWTDSSHFHHFYTLDHPRKHSRSLSNSLECLMEFVQVAIDSRGQPVWEPHGKSRKITFPFSESLNYLRILLEEFWAYECVCGGNGNPIPNPVYQRNVNFVSWGTFDFSGYIGHIHAELIQEGSVRLVETGAWSKCITEIGVLIFIHVSRPIWI